MRHLRTLDRRRRARPGRHDDDAVLRARCSRASGAETACRAGHGVPAVVLRRDAGLALPCDVIRTPFARSKAVVVPMLSCTNRSPAPSVLAARRSADQRVQPSTPRCRRASLEPHRCSMVPTQPAWRRTQHATKRLSMAEPTRALHAHPSARRQAALGHRLPQRLPSRRLLRPSPLRARLLALRSRRRSAPRCWRGRSPRAAGASAGRNGRIASGADVRARSSRNLPGGAVLRSFSTTPIALSSSRMRSDSLKFFALRAALRASIERSTFAFVSHTA